MSQLPSPRLPGVMVLRAEATGPEYARWRREIKFAFLQKDTWAYCDGSRPMPMPDAGPNFFSPVSATNSQPTLLEERRAWVKQDRDVKLDIFLSVADDIKLEVFDVGPPLPPSSMTAQEMFEALDERFAEFRFEDYHHVFCHFLNLHIDQYSSIEDFNAEFQATLDDLLDHGHPMSNVQACSAYFSKLRCTQNPWVVKILKDWDVQEVQPQLADLMTQSPPWSIIKPLSTTHKPTTQTTLPASIPEESSEDIPAQTDGEDTPSDRSEVETIGSKSSHSRHASDATTKSQEITIHASYEDLTNLTELAELQAFPPVPNNMISPTDIPKRASSIAKFALQPLTSPIDRPLPPLPSAAEARSVVVRARSASPKASSMKSPLFSDTPYDSTMAFEPIHPALRQLPATPLPTHESADRQADVHPALRMATPPPSEPTAGAKTLADHIAASLRPQTPTFPMMQGAFMSSSPNLNLSGSLFIPSTPEVQRPSSARTNVSPQQSVDQISILSDTRPLLQRVSSNSSSVISLPLQGTTPESKDTLILESPPPKLKKQLSKIEMARLRFEGFTGSPPRGLGLTVPRSCEDENKQRKRSWSIKSRLSARHGIKEII